MAKTKTKSAEASELSVSEQLEQQQLLADYRRAIAKRNAGKRLTKADTADIERYTDHLARVHGDRYLRAMPKRDFQEATGITRETCLRWHRERSFPYVPNRRSINLWDVVFYLLDHFRGNTSQSLPLGASPEEILLNGASDALKEEFIRERIREKRITNAQQQIKLEQQLEQFIPIEPVIETHNFLAERIRRTREQLARLFDGESRDRVEQAFDDLIDDFVREVESRFPHDSSPTPTD